MGQYTTSPTTVTALQFDGTQGSIAPLLGGQAFYFGMGGIAGNAVVEGARGRLALNPTDWLIRLPTSTADIYDDSNDFILSAMPNAAFTQQYTYVAGT